MSLNLTRRAGLIGATNLSVPEKWRLLGELFSIRPPIVATGAIASVAVTSAGRQVPLTLWLWLGLAVLGCWGRIIVSRRFQRRAPSDQPSRWEIRFFWAATLSGIVWGFGAVVVAANPEPGLELAVLAVACALISGACVRSYCAPLATLAQVSFACASFSAAFAIRHQWGLIVTLTLYLAFQYMVVRDLGRSALARINAETQRTELNAKLIQANKELERMALTDSLTDLANRRGFDLFIGELWRLAVNHNQAIALLFVDVDHFKRFNDEHGHPAGDACLTQIGAALKTALHGPSEFAARYGGEEFALVLPNTDQEGASIVAHRARELVAELDMSTLLGQPCSVTVSIGAAVMYPAQEGSPAALIHLADCLVYEAKQNGRNRVCFTSMKSETI